MQFSPASLLLPLSEAQTSLSTLPSEALTRAQHKPDDGIYRISRNVALFLQRYFAP
jgi:hypothetical protein